MHSQCGYIFVLFLKGTRGFGIENIIEILANREKLQKLFFHK